MKVNFNQLINGKKSVLVDFQAEWCASSKTLAPIINFIKQNL